MTPEPSNAHPLTNPVGVAERIDVLDILRGVALLGMFVVHFLWQGDTGASAIGRFLAYANTHFLANRFMTMFAILFGVGFAVQLARADGRSDRFAVRFVRRLLMLAVFGIIAEVLFGYSILFGYALWGFPLLFMRRWSTRALTVATLVCIMSPPMYWVGRAGYDVVTGGREKFRRDENLCFTFGLPFANLPSYNAQPECNDAREARGARIRAQRAGPQPNRADYGVVVASRITRMWSGYVNPRPYTFLPTNVLSLFLLGVLGFRLGVFQRPGEHRGLIVGLMVFGVVSDLLATYATYDYLATPAAAAAPLPVQITVGFVALPIFRDVWLAFVYIGAVLLLVDRWPVWLHRLRAFGITGRMALTNYIAQVIILDFAFNPHGLGLQIGILTGLLAALALFAVDVAVCTWWLGRYRLGPLEWIWRSVTYWELQPMGR